MKEKKGRTEGEMVGCHHHLIGYEVEHVEGNGNLLQYSCLENPMCREAWQTTVHEVAESPKDATERLTLSLLRMCQRLCYLLYI